MKETIEKLIVYVIPFLIILSICYNNGYWSVFPINIYDYYQVQDILKAIAMPAFNFFGLIALPCMIIIGMVFSLSTSDAEANKVVPSKKPETESLQFSKKARTILKIIAVVASLFGIPFFLYMLAYLSYALTPYIEQEKFMSMYLTTINTGTKIRMSIVCLLVPISMTMLISSVKSMKPIQELRLLILFASVLATFTIAFHAGRIEPYKIASGYDFYFLIDENQQPLKYLGKYDKYFIFSNDNKYIDKKGTMEIELDTISYSVMVTIISEDSLKALSLARYHTFETVNKGTFRKYFKARNILVTDTIKSDQ